MAHEHLRDTPLSVRSAIEFLRADGTRVDAHRDAELDVTSGGLGWRGIAVEGGHMPGWDVSDLVVPDAMVALNTDTKPLTFERVEAGRTRRVTMPSGSVWINPPGETVTHRLRACSRFLNVTVSPELSRRLTGHDELELRPALGVAHPQLAAVMTALAAEAREGGRHGPLQLDTLAIAMVNLLLADFASWPPKRANASLSRRQVAMIEELVEARLGDGVSVADLARHVGYSPAHFARAFRVATGMSPHQFVIARRLARARAQLLSTRRNVAEIAADVGFADHAHLTRAFRKVYGTTPASLRRS